MAIHGRFVSIALAMGAIIALTGCGRTPEVPIGAVNGLVTLDGQPLPEVTVIFDPKEGGRPSVARTDAEGHYVLNYSNRDKGAKIGSHEVQVFYQEEMEPTPASATRPKIPSRYNEKTELSYDVAEGNNEINIELSSK
ncbi:hypothetical protein Pan216_24580 [Planctomycetes bacterium Pan216]|uniref:Carboxypeptidase regulatory-like domain-containing protein n=1 Tax=Kolteria novifilia TaxID=2527975 RepID=A0A518B3P5_9BACT|nr:hypothetical protein Pan216_24580 [Planctomycetes bacterium Pan216]